VIPTALEIGGEASMLLEFEKAWSDLNARLKELELGSGLTTALHALETLHRETGFIEDPPEQVERHTFYHPGDQQRFFRVQYNPRRALRFAGTGHKDAFSLKHNNGCHLCRENIYWQQQGAQLGYEIEIGERLYFALMNPFPLLPAHTVIASPEHRSQDWRDHSGGHLDVTMLLDDLVRLAERMPSHLGFYNGVDAGASIPDHLHYHFAMRPDDNTAFPLEIAARHVDTHNDAPSFTKHYPLEAAVWKGDGTEVVARAADWITRWGERNRTRLAGLTANFIATRDIDGDDMALYFVPHDPAKSRAEGFTGLLGGLEVLGEIVLSSPEDNDRLSNGQIDYFTLEGMLTSVHTPMDID
jgi:diadenosine tetraphosphate (Ap4A) HIT family hydrolase